MPINTRHPSFAAMDDSVRTMRDVMAGDDAVKLAGERYLPKLGGQDTADYNAYKKRALFYGACVRTKEALAGAITRKHLQVHGPEEWTKKYKDDITGTGVSLNSFAGELVHEMLTTSLEGILVEHDGQRPFLSRYCQENVTNILPDGTVVLRDKDWAPDPKDPYTLAEKVTYRELRMVDGVPFVRTWTLPEKAKAWVHGPDMELLFRGQPLKEIPFTLAQIAGIPLLPLAQANLSHYLTSADLENGLHWGGIFTPWIAGNMQPLVDGSMPEFKIGGSSAWVLPTGSQVGMLEITGSALAALEARLLGKQQLMAALGARLLIESKKAAETEATTRINASGEGATLSLVVDAVESALNRALHIMARWDGVADVESIKVEMNRDFVDSKLSSLDITAYLGLYTAGVIDLETLLIILEGGEILPDGRTPEDIKALLDAQAPPMAKTPPVDKKPAPDKQPATK
jgi:hypothetical protein